MTDPSLTGASILVVGATGGLGAAVSRMLADRGARLTLVGRSAERLEALDVPGARAALDMRKAASGSLAVGATVEAYGQLDGVVFAAGEVAFGSIDETPDSVVIDLFTLNALAPMRLVKAAQPALVESASAGRSPFIAHISAVVAEAPMPGMAAYSASKAALHAWDQAAARELRRQGIRLIDARPPHTETGLADRAIFGTAPRLPQGLTADAVAARIVRAIEDGEKDLPSESFTP